MGLIKTNSGGGGVPITDYEALQSQSIDSMRFRVSQASSSGSGTIDFTKLLFRDTDLTNLFMTESNQAIAAKDFVLKFCLGSYQIQTTGSQNGFRCHIYVNDAYIDEVITPIASFSAEITDMAEIELHTGDILKLEILKPSGWTSSIVWKVFIAYSITLI